MPRTVNADKELDDLPNGAVFIADGDAFQKDCGRYLRTGDEGPYTALELQHNGYWPVTVLWPESEAR